MAAPILLVQTECRLLAKEVGCLLPSLRDWSRYFDVDAGKAEGLTSDEREELRLLRREVRTLIDERGVLGSGRLLC